MSSGPESASRGGDWAAAERRQDEVYAERQQGTADVGEPTGDVRPESLAVRTEATAKPKIDTSVPHPARRYNYWLHGKDNFATDRASADEIEKLYPEVRTAAIENRRFLQRAVRFLTAECGVRQFLDIGTGLPTEDNTHEVAQRIAPAARIVYVDNDPLVMVHARALLTSEPEGGTAYIQADLRDPAAILAEAVKTLDFGQPIGLMLVAVLHFLLDRDEPAKIVSQLQAAMPAGSYLVLSHATGDAVDEAIRAAWDEAARSGRHGDFQYRGRAEVLKLLGGWDLVAPGLVPVAEWHREPPAEDPVPFGDAAAYAAVARRPRRHSLRPLDDDWDEDTHFLGTPI